MYKCILFIGLGGAGQRHLRIFREKLPSVRMIGVRRTGKTPLLNADFSVNNSSTLESEYNIEFFKTLDEAYEQKPDLVVIATPTFDHSASIIKAAKHKANILVEKPGAMNIKQAHNVTSTIKDNKVGFFISYQRRFHPLVGRLRSVLDSNKIGKLMSVRVAVSSYVPDWHPYEDFHDLYACRSDLGGGVLRTESHEIDMINLLFGSPNKIFSAGGCRGKFDIDVEDSANLLFNFSSFSLQISLCFMQKKQERCFKLFGHDGWLELDLIKQKLVICRYEDEEKEKEEHIRIMENDDLFRIQANYFLNEFVPNDDQYLNALKVNSIVIDKSLKNI